jgi:hypothetical protein
MSAPSEATDALITPGQSEVLAALRAGYRAIDDGFGFYAGFNGWLESLGYVKRDDLRCTCPDAGDHGHLPECRWTRSESE